MWFLVFSGLGNVVPVVINVPLALIKFIILSIINLRLLADSAGSGAMLGSDDVGSSFHDVSLYSGAPSCLLPKG